MFSQPVDFLIEDKSQAQTKRCLFHHPQEYECHYTAITESSADYTISKKYFDGYNFFSSSGIESYSDTIACCLTSYNEPLIEYQKTIESLCSCAEFFKIKGEDRVSREFLICIIVDGIDNMSHEFSVWAEDIGIYKPSHIDDHANFHMFESLLPRKNLYSACIHNSSFNFPGDKDNESLQRVILFIKERNRGKLNSHQCFFDRVCSFYSAKYFVQIDVGTTPMVDTLYKMWLDLQSNPDVAATAARSLLPYPDNTFDLLQVWQYCDIAVERIINWPSEIFLGSLSVLPGQLSLTRMSSVVDQSINDDSVLDRYYRGLDNLSPFESNMYLAEDRILSQEIIFRKNRRYELSYQTDAEATIDACQSWSELCRQRRRWICSSMACRIAMLKKLPGFFSNPSRNLHEKLHKLTASIYFTIYSLLEWFVPSTHLIVQVVLTNQSLTMTDNKFLTSVTILLGCITFLSVFVQSIISFSGKLTFFNQKLINYGLIVQSINMAFNLFLLILSGAGNVLISLLFISLSMYISIAYYYDKSLASKLAMTILQYSFSRLPIKAFLITYSAFNAHDTSWGTKGLSSSEQIKKSSTVKVQYKKFRIFVISLFILSNSLLFFCLLNFFHGETALYVAIYIILAQLVVAIFAVINFSLKSERKII